MAKSDITRPRWMRAIIALANPRDWTRRWNRLAWLALGLLLGNIIAVALFLYPIMMSKYRMCHDPAYKRERMTQYLAGIYYGGDIYSWSRQKLTLKEDGTCLQEVTFNKGRGFQNAQGTWAYCHNYGLDQVCLYGNFVDQEQTRPKAVGQVQVSSGGSIEPPVKAFKIKYLQGCTYFYTDSDFPDEWIYDYSRCELEKAHP